MPERSDPNILLGKVIGKLEAIEERLKRQDESRASLHRRLDDLVMRTTHVESDLSSMKNKVENMEQVTIEVTTMRNKAQGAGTLGRWLLKFGGWVLSAAGGFAAAWTLLTGRPPP